MNNFADPYFWLTIIIVVSVFEMLMWSVGTIINLIRIRKNLKQARQHKWMKEHKWVVEPYSGE